MKRNLSFRQNLKMRYIVIVLLILALLFLTDVSVIFASDVPLPVGSAKILSNDINTMVKLINTNSPASYDYFVKVTKECYPDAEIKVTKEEFLKFITLSHNKNLTSADRQFMNFVINKLKTSYYGKKSPALILLCKEELNSIIKKDTLDLMKNQHCSYDEAREKALNAVVSRNPKLAKELGINANVKISSTPQSREEAFLYAQPYDVASVLSSWGDLILYSIWTSHDGWIKKIVFTSDRHGVRYLNIYEALPNGGNIDSRDRYPNNPKGAYDSWIENSMHVYVQRYPDYSLAQRAYNASVYMYYGKPYNWIIPNKYDPNRSYCSQNVWAGFWAYGVNLDSNLDIPMLYVTHPWAVSIEETGVLPDSIYLSPHLELVSSG